MRFNYTGWIVMVFKTLRTARMRNFWFFFSQAHKYLSHVCQFRCSEIKYYTFMRSYTSYLNSSSMVRDTCKQYCPQAQRIPRYANIRVRVNIFAFREHPFREKKKTALNSKYNIRYRTRARWIVTLSLTVSGPIWRTRVERGTRRRRSQDQTPKSTS